MKEIEFSNTGYQLVTFTHKLLKEAGFEIKWDASSSDDINRYKADLIAEKEGNTYCIEVKRNAINHIIVSSLFEYTYNTEMIPVIIIFREVSEQKKKYYKKDSPKLEIVDLANLLYAVKDDYDLKTELTALLPFTVDNIFPKESILKTDGFRYTNKFDSLINELSLCEPGTTGFRKYEEVCHDILFNIFSEDLTLWKKQQPSNQYLYRFDLLCRIKDNNQRTFWSILENYFKSKYIIFEFKNYKGWITQKEVYSTERYLYSKALRSVGIMITPTGYDSHAIWAAKGALRENGKLILLLTNDDLIKMINRKKDGEDPSEFLLDRLDEILLNLEK